MMPTQCRRLRWISLWRQPDLLVNVNASTQATFALLPQSHVIEPQQRRGNLLNLARSLNN